MSPRPKGSSALPGFDEEDLLQLKHLAIRKAEIFPGSGVIKK
jgi:hypothetical protein